MNEEDVRPEGFWAKVNKTDDCWLWGGHRGRRGYGQYGRGNRRTHRIAYALTYGPIPAGINVLHRCDNPPCVRPDHLFLGTHEDNIRDRDTKGRQFTPRGTRNGSWKLTDQQVNEVRTLAGKLLQREIAAMFGIGQVHVSRILRGEQRALPSSFSPFEPAAREALPRARGDTRPGAPA